MPMPVVLVERQCFRRQSSRPAHDRAPFPLALRFVAGTRRVGEIKIYVVDHDEIERSIAVEIHECAPGAPSVLRSQKSAFLGLIFKCAIPLVAIENVLAPLRDEEIGGTVIIDIAGTYALSPAGATDARLFCDIFEFQ